MNVGLSWVVACELLEATALVDRDVDEHRTRTHRGDQVVGDELGSLGAGHQDRADHQVGLADGLLDRERARRDRRDHAGEPGVDLAQLGDVEVEDLHVGAHAARDLGSVDSETPAPITTTSAG